MPDVVMPYIIPLSCSKRISVSVIFSINGGSGAVFGADNVCTVIGFDVATVVSVERSKIRTTTV